MIGKDGLENACAHVVAPRPKVAAERDGQKVKRVHPISAMCRHHHGDIDNMLLVGRGAIQLEFWNCTVTLAPFDAPVPPKAVGRPVAEAESESESEVPCFKPAVARCTVDIDDPSFTAPPGAGA